HHLSFPYTLRRPPTPPPFPYTTLFRSRHVAVGVAAPQHPADHVDRAGPVDLEAHRDPRQERQRLARDERAVGRQIAHHAREPLRSEEHTSELQSRSDLVCRLLLEKKNI